MSSSTPSDHAAARSARTDGSATPPRKGGPRRSWPKRILLAVLGLGLLGVIGLVVAYLLTPIPKANDAATAQATILYYSDGKTELDRISEVNRESIALAKIPLPVQQAFLAAEDRSFYDNSGISPTGLGRAVWTAVKGGQTQGGSTITQQYVKNYFLTADQTYTRKFKEIMISLKLDQQLSKDQILENYLNTIYFGRGANGIQTASKAYFGKDASRLTVAEGALLASVIRGPSFYDPAQGEEQKALAEGRWDYVLDGMVSQGWLEQSARDGLTFPQTSKATARRGAGGTTGYVTQLVKNELLRKVKLTDAEIDRKGLRIVTTIDKPKQDAAVAAVKAKMPDEPDDLKVGLASVKPGDGAVVALYGGADYQKIQFNNATDATIQAGSTFKIFTLIAALQDDLSTARTFGGASPQYFEEFKDSGASSDFLREGGVRNFGGQSFGTMDVCSATASSVNTIYAQLNILADPRKTTEAARTAGVTTRMTSVYANVFGTDDVKVLDMANAYATIAANGRKATPYFVRSVTTLDKDISYKAKPVVKAVFDEDLMSDVIDCMTQVVSRGSGSYAGARLDRPAAGKTGTTTDNYGAWFDGFVPQLSAAVGIYRGDGSQKEANQMNQIPGVGQMTGGATPVQIWTDYMTVAVKGMKVVRFPEPAHINRDKLPTRTVTPPPVTQTQSTTSTTPSTTTTTTTTVPTPTPTEPTTTQPPTVTGTTEPSITLPPPTPTPTRGDAVEPTGAGRPTASGGQPTR